MTPGFNAKWGRRSIAANGRAGEKASVALRLQEARQAQERLERGEQMGKITLDIG